MNWFLKTAVFPLIAVSLSMPLFAQSQKTADELPLSELRAFTEVMEHIKNAYVKEVDDKTLLENAIRGMLGDLDPHSTYLDTSDYKALEENTTGEFGGLGVEVNLDKGLIKIISPLDGSPAAKAGIEAGDLIYEINGKPVKGQPISESVAQLKGKPGTKVKLSVYRGTGQKSLNFTVTREIVHVQSVRSKTLSPGIGYVRLVQFQEHTGADFKKALAHLKAEQPNQQFKGLVLDLRNNPGGLLESAVEITDALIDDGMIVYTKGRIEGGDLEYTATPGNLINSAPIVVLINGGSASASEIVAGALQDHQRAIIMGQQSFGKGSVQTVLPLNVDSKRGLKLTTALYYTPNDRTINGTGITPDSLMPAQPKETKVFKADQDYQLEKAQALLERMANEKLTIQTVLKESKLQAKSDSNSNNRK